MRISQPKKLDLFGRQLLEATMAWPEQGEAEVAAVRSGLATQEGLGGPDVARFELAFARIQGLLNPAGEPKGYHALAVTNGTHAIQLILEGLGIGVYDRVIVPGLTWQATGGAALDVNAVPVLIDSGADWTIDVDLVEAHLAKTQGTAVFPKAVIAVHLYDRAADVVRLAEICKRYGVFLIEDCAHAIGAIVAGKALGTWGVAGSYSFQASKGFTTGGEGGAIVTGVAFLARRMRSLISCGRSMDEILDFDVEVDEITRHWRDAVAALNLAPFGDQSGNFRLSHVQASLGIAQAARFEGWYSARKATLDKLTVTLPQVPGITYRNQPSATNPVAYMLAFEYEADEYAGMDNELFREVLHYLLGSGETQLVLPTYDPLGGGTDGYRSPVYNPLTKPRHLLNAEYAAAIDPSKANLPRAHEIFRRGITIQHSFLREAGAAEVLIKALTLMHSKAAEIVAAAALAA
jgi:L-glutamine:2-deoxy-scyllo-inosose/3-amino-2,3-dideoxy-scyllo-inosose aminotransferase